MPFVVDRVAFEGVVRAWLIDATGIPGERVLFGNQNIKQPAYPYISINYLSNFVAHPGEMFERPTIESVVDQNQTIDFTIPSVQVGQVYSLTINEVQSTRVALVGDTATIIRDDLLGQLTTAPGVTLASQGVDAIRAVNSAAGQPLDFTITSNINLNEVVGTNLETIVHRRAVELNIQIRQLVNASLLSVPPTPSLESNDMMTTAMDELTADDVRESFYTNDVGIGNVTNDTIVGAIDSRKTINRSSATFQFFVFSRSTRQRTGMREAIPAYTV